MQFGIAESERRIRFQGFAQAFFPFGFRPKAIDRFERVLRGKHEPDFLGDMLRNGGLSYCDMPFVNRVERSEIEEGIQRKAWSWHL